MKKESLHNFDLAKVIGSLLIVCIHTNPASGTSQWIQFYLMDVVARIAVPLFFGMSGYLFFGRLTYENGKIKFGLENQTRLLRQTGRTAVLYLGWSAAYLLIVQIPSWHRSGWCGIYVIKDYLVSLFFRGSYYHFWYLLAFLYAVPLLYALLSSIPIRKAVLIAVVLWICECLTYSYTWLGIDRFTPVMLIAEKMPIVYDTLFRAIPLLFIGAYLSQYATSGPQNRWAVPLSLLLWAAEATTLRLLNPESGRYSYLFSMLPASYFLLKALLQSKAVPMSVANRLRMRSLSTNVYLIHPMVIALLSPLSLPKGLAYFFAVVTVSAILSVLYKAGTTGLRCFTFRLGKNSFLNEKTTKET